MKYLKKFNTHSDYETFTGSTEFILPNVSYCVNEDEAHFSPYVYTPELVDMGLPSGTLWATTNIGANSPVEVGLYFEYGGIEGYSAEQVGVDKRFSSDFSDYKYANGNNKFTKYCTSSSYGYNGFTDGLKTLLPEDDAATQLFGATWSIPSVEQAQELLNNATAQMTTLSGVNGCLFTSVIEGYTDKSIFIPSCGSAVNGGITNSEYVYCNLNYTELNRYYYRYSIFVGNGYTARVGTSYRYVGYPIRPVRVETNLK